jgi:hypothetical protein
VSTPSQSSVSTPGPDLTPRPTTPSQSPLDAPLNLHHIDLLLHLHSISEICNLSVAVGNRLSNLLFALQTGLTAPYLLHQLLALSARHLASLHPSKSPTYLHLATTLQTRAISLFNATALTAVDRSNCVAVLLFSSVLGHHLLADTLIRRDHASLDGFLTHYVQAMEVNRGVYVVTMASWPLLMTTEVGPTIAASAEFTRRQGKGRHCDALRELFGRGTGLTDVEREVCVGAVRHLQVGFDAVDETDREDEYRFQMILSWTMMAPKELGRLLMEKRAEVLVMLGYYALLLDLGSGMWQVGDAGRYLLGLVVRALPVEWHGWLAYPRERMGV